MPLLLKVILYPIIFWLQILKRHAFHYTCRLCISIFLSPFQYFCTSVSLRSAPMYLLPVTTLRPTFLNNSFICGKFVSGMTKMILVVSMKYPQSGPHCIRSSKCDFIRPYLSLYPELSEYQCCTNSKCISRRFLLMIGIILILCAIISRCFPWVTPSFLLSNLPIPP